MKLLLDTHTFIWWDSQSSQIPTSTLELLRTPEHSVLLSLVSIWEIQIKAHLGKLELRQPLLDVVQRQESQNRVAFFLLLLTILLSLTSCPGIIKIRLIGFSLLKVGLSLQRWCQKIRLLVNMIAKHFGSRSL
ncbi:twitching motility protein [Leptolyngbya sp. Heron Island J]|nr:twitching motility protein [Leptolyngbya sp. Heron Island J]